jgi:hypothetical protein
MIRTISPTAIERRYRSAKPEGTWFDPDETRFFGTRVSAGFVSAREVVYFTTSEKCPFSSGHHTRLHSVRRLDSRTGEIDTVDATGYWTPTAFQDFETRGAAQRVALRLAEADLDRFAAEQEEDEEAMELARRAGGLLG